MRNLIKEKAMGLTSVVSAVLIIAIVVLFVFALNKDDVLFRAMVIGVHANETYYFVAHEDLTYECYRGTGIWKVKEDLDMSAFYETYTKKLSEEQMKVLIGNIKDLEESGYNIRFDFDEEVEEIKHWGNGGIPWVVPTIGVALFYHDKCYAAWMPYDETEIFYEVAQQLIMRSPWVIKREPWS